MLLLAAFDLHAQSLSVSGKILAAGGSPLAFATAVLLDPADSTLVYYGISDDDGSFGIRNIDRGNYLMQVAFLGYESMYREVVVPAPGNDALVFVMSEKPVGIGAVTVSGEAVPITIKKDTVEFNRSAFRTREGAVVEDLLKKLPGIEVDRIGNIKAMGEDVNKVYVDGREFFGSDPKIATKNIPARAVDKVQMFDKRSEESEFTGIDDGSREKALNLVLEDDMKKMMFGNVSAGIGTSSLYRAKAKAYYFTDKIHLATLGMINNANDPGFSLGDYMDFSGGLMAMSQGTGKIEISTGGNFPVNFGQDVYGRNSSGAAGFNFSRSTEKDRRIFISYLANAAHRTLQEDSRTWNYLPSGTFFQKSSNLEAGGDTAHRVNFGIRHRIDSTRNFTFDAALSVNRSGKVSDLLILSGKEGNQVNRLDGHSANGSDRLSGAAGTSYISKIKAGRTVLKVTGNLKYRRDLSGYRFDNLITYYDPFREEADRQYQDNSSDASEGRAAMTLSQRISKYMYLQPELSITAQDETLDRNQGIPEPENTVIDSLSPVMEKNYRTRLLGITFMRYKGKGKLSLSARLLSSRLSSVLDEVSLHESVQSRFMPAARYEYEFSTGRRISLNYSTSLDEPSVGQLLPVVNNINPTYLVHGNPSLESEYAHEADAHLFLFDQFSFSSFFVAVVATYTRNKINWSSTISDELVQTLVPVNVKQDLEVRGNMNFSTPIKKLGVKVHLNVEERWDKGFSLVDGQENQQTSISHRYSLSADNRKKQKWDLNGGMTATLTRSRYSIREDLNDRYTNLSWFGEVLFTPNEHWDFSLKADLVNYGNESFGESVFVPLVGGALNYRFLANNRAAVTLKISDLLNRNTGIQRLGELNYLREIRRNMLGRYLMLSFTWRLNKSGQPPNHIDIKMKSH